MGRRKPPRVTGVALVDKPAGVTSHDVVQTLRRGVGQGQVGHTGTLDPAATGLMVVTLGRATRLGRFLEATDKAYDGTVFLGRSTTTWDGEGETTEARPLEAPLEPAAVEAALAGLTGSFEQVVPAFSAVKVEGERLYARARRGEAVEGPRRTVRIERLELLGIDGPEMHIRCAVEKGTYIRSLAVAIGRRLGYPAHLSRLRRTRVGPHEVSSAHAPERFGDLEPPILSPAEALCHLPAVELDAEAVWGVAHGRAPLSDRTRARGPGFYRLLDGAGRLVAMARGPEDPAGQPGLEVVMIRPEEVARTV